jgi:hypothetical protein
MKEVIMFLRNAFLGTALFALMSSTAMAGPATPEEAARLLAVLQTYLGAEPGVVTVVPAGDAYTVTLDFAPVIAKASPETFHGSITPYVLSITDNGDGTWSTQSDQAFSANFEASGTADISYSIGSWKSTGVFDEALGAFSQSRSEFSDIAMTQTMTLPDQPPSNSSSSAAGGVYESVSTAGVDGGIDSKITYAFTNYSQSMAVPGAPGAPASDVVITAESYLGDGKMTALDPAAFYKLLAWFVAHPSPEAIKADQAGLKTLLTDGIPFFQNIVASGGMTNAKIATPVGEFTAASISADVEMNGLVKDGLVREAITLNGLTIPDGLAPEWSAGLVPSKLSLDFAVSGFDAASPAAALIAAFDLAKPDPIDPAMEGPLMAALIPNGTVDIKLAPGIISSDMYSVTYEGAMTAGPGGIPVGKATITMTGMDAVMAALQAAPPEVGGQMAPMLGMAQGMAKPGSDGALVWDVDASVPGTLMVNGTDLMAMMGGQ